MYQNILWKSTALASSEAFKFVCVILHWVMKCVTLIAMDCLHRFVISFISCWFDEICWIHLLLDFKGDVEQYVMPVFVSVVFLLSWPIFFILWVRTCWKWSTSSLVPMKKLGFWRKNENEEENCAYSRYNVSNSQQLTVCWHSFVYSFHSNVITITTWMCVPLSHLMTKQHITSFCSSSF